MAFNSSVENSAMLEGSAFEDNEGIFVADRRDDLAGSRRSWQAS